jgi:putative ABC transport system permease protein
VQTLLQDLRYTVRALRARPGFAAIALITLALGIGANTAIFSVVHQVLLSPPPFAEPERLYIASRTIPGFDEVGPWSYPDFELLRERTRTADVAAFRDLGVALTGGAGEPERVNVEMVSPNYFTLVGVPVAHGRGFATSDGAASAPAVAVLSDALWRSRFGAAPAVLGTTVTLNGALFEVVGVMPAGFAGQTGDAALWVTITQAPVLMSDPRRLTRAFSNWANVVARVTAADAATAAAEMDVIAASLAELREEAPPDARGIGLLPLSTATTDPRLRKTLLILLGAVALVLLVACANLANLLLARATGRRREMALRRALGAGGGRLVRQLLTESGALAMMGGIAGAGLAWAAVRVLAVMRPAEPARFGAIAGDASFDALVLDPRILLFNFGIALAAGVLFGLAPALIAARADVATLLREAAAAITPRRRLGRVRAVLVAGELALALVLLAGAALLIRSFVALHRVDTGIEAENVLTVGLELPRSRYDGGAAESFHAQLLERLRDRPGVAAAGVATALPLARAGGATTVDIENAATIGDEPPVAGYHLVDGGYFDALGIPVVRGRVFSPADRAGAPRVAVINETAARLFFPAGDALGRHIRLGVGYEPSDEYAEIVGVVGDVKYAGIDEPVRPDAYLAAAQFMENRAFLVVRTNADPLALLPAVREEVAALDAGLPLFDVKTMDRRVADATSRPRFASLLLGLFAALATVLAAIGVYGVTAFSVAARAREFGIRRALGADTLAVLLPVLHQGLLLALAGVAVGVVGALAAGRLLASQLFGVAPSDPVTLAGVAALLLATTLLAAYIPARRAARVDPLVVLRED